ncbi:hypothetical protein C8J56DRAFT_546532 [Mycena floridula]|nr:hypothetical protein C8J56DRAFT_546532 [Mycena floridula]
MIDFSAGRGLNKLEFPISTTMSRSSHCVISLPEAPSVYDPNQPFSARVLLAFESLRKNDNLLQNRYPDAAFFRVDRNVFLRFSGRQIADSETAILEFTNSDDQQLFETIAIPGHLRIWSVDGATEEFMSPVGIEQFYYVDIQSTIHVFNITTKSEQTFRVPWKSSVDLSIGAFLRRGEPELSEREFSRRIREMLPLHNNIKQDIDFPEPDEETWRNLVFAKFNLRI